MHRNYHFSTVFYFIGDDGSNRIFGVDASDSFSCVVPPLKAGGNIIWKLYTWSPKRNRYLFQPRRSPLSSTLIGSKLETRCRKGYSRSNGSAERTEHFCIPGGVWNPPLENCYATEPVNCTVPSEDTEGFFRWVFTLNPFKNVYVWQKNVTSTTPIHSKLITQCKEGYSRIDGSDRNTEYLCKSGGVWDPPLMNCFVNCIVPPEDTEGLFRWVYTLDLSTNKYVLQQNELSTVPRRSKLITQCKEGYSRIDGSDGNTEYMCEFKSTWDPPFKNCSVNCIVPPEDIEGLFRWVYMLNPNTKKYALQRNESSTAPLRSKLITRCEKSYSRADGSAGNTEHLCDLGGAWNPPLENCSYSKWMQA